MRIGFGKFTAGKTLFISILLLANVYAVPEAKAASWTSPFGCKVDWTIDTPSGTKGIQSSFNIVNKDKLSGYVGHAKVSGDGCENYSGRFTYYAYTSADNTGSADKTRGECTGALQTKTYDYPITFENIDTYKSFSLDFWVFSPADCNDDLAVKDLEIKATVKLSTGGGPTCGVQGKPACDNNNGGGGGNTKVTCSDPKKTVIDVSKGEKCPAGTVTCLYSDGSSKPVNSDGTCPPGKVESEGKLWNPIKSESLISLAMSILRYFLAGVAALAVVFIVMGGFRLVVSRGNPEAVTRGKDILIWAIAGLLVALMALSLVAIVQNLLGAF